MNSSAKDSGTRMSDFDTQHDDADVRRNREGSIQSWYANPVSRKGGLDTGARGWRWVVEV